MEEAFKEFAGYVAVGVEAAAAALIAFGALEALYRTFRSAFDVGVGLIARRDTFVRFGSWLMLGLEFELAADIIRSAITPTWTEIGMLAAIAVIRTFLNYFLERDIGEVAEARLEVGRKGLAVNVAESN